MSFLNGMIRCFLKQWQREEICERSGVAHTDGASARQVERFIFCREIALASLFMQRNSYLEVVFLQFWNNIKGKSID